MIWEFVSFIMFTVKFKLKCILVLLGRLEVDNIVRDKMQTSMIFRYSNIYKPTRIKMGHSISISTWIFRSLPKVVANLNLRKFNENCHTVISKRT